MKRQYLAAGIGCPDQYTKVLSGFDLQPLFVCHQRLPTCAPALACPRIDIVVAKSPGSSQLKGHDDLIGVAPGLVRSVPQIKLPAWSGAGNGVLAWKAGGAR